MQDVQHFLNISKQTTSFKHALHQSFAVAPAAVALIMDLLYEFSWTQVNSLQSATFIMGWLTLQISWLMFWEKKTRRRNKFYIIADRANLGYSKISNDSINYLNTISMVNNASLDSTANKIRFLGCRVFRFLTA